MRAPIPNQKLLSKVKLFCMSVDDGLHGCGLYHSYGVNLQINMIREKWIKRLLKIRWKQQILKKSTASFCVKGKFALRGESTLLLRFSRVLLQYNLHFDFQNYKSQLRVSGCNLLAELLHTTWEGVKSELAITLSYFTTAWKPIWQLKGYFWYFRMAALN